MFNIETVGVLGRFHLRVLKEAGDSADEAARSFDPAPLITILNTVIPIISQLISLCKKQPPVTPPMPEALTGCGVSSENWEKAFQSNWGASASWKEDKQKYTPAIVNQMAKQIAEREDIKKKLAKPSAVAALNASRQESIEDLAIALQDIETHNSGGVN